ncbi:hypothetical protein HZR84_08385 [Hyphobacterium sp. CCMP332]|nr:hypothetical protein HZR84_08385 [Hyphobacterium sp. CCMP332]
MNKITNYFALLPFLILPLLFTACNNDDEGGDEEPTPQAETNTNPQGVASYNYSVQVVPGNATIDGKVSGIEGAFVTISQGGESMVQTTVAGGIAHFEGLNPGTVNGSVLTGEDDPVVNFTAEILPETLNNDSNQVRNVSSTITVFQKNSELQARIYGDYNLLGVPPALQDPNNFKSTSVFVVYTILDYPMGSGNGKLTDVNVELTSVNFRSPSTGEIRITDIPGTVEGVLEAELFMEDVVVRDNNTGGDVLFNIHPIRNQPGTPLNLVPGGTYNLGDIEAQRRI